MQIDGGGRRQRHLGKARFLVEALRGARAKAKRPRLAG
jgi:hypothetical protein